MDDLISRQAAIDLLLSINEVVPKNKLIDKNDAIKALVRLPSAQPDVPDRNVGDLISRQAAIDEIARWIGYIDEDMILRIQTGLKKVPSAQRTGRWMFTDAAPHRVYCSECYKTFIPNKEWYAWAEHIVPRNYCPNCGARMGREEDE